MRLAVVVLMAAAMAYGWNLLVRIGLVNPWPEGIRLEAVEAAAGYEAYLLPVGGFPVAEKHLGVLRDFLDRLTEAAAAEFGLQTEVFLQGNGLRRRNGASLLASHGREWIPMTGLGVWPDRSPPRLWNWKDLVLKLPGTSPRTLMYNVYRVSTGDQARRQARNTMLGGGTVLQIMGTQSLEAFLEKTQAVLLPPIQEPTFRSFPYFVPLVERKSARAGELGRWLCGAVVYIRESPEDDAIVIVSGQPLGPVLEKLGARREGNGYFLRRS